MTIIKPYTTLAAWPVAVIRALIAQGVDPEPLLEKASLTMKGIEGDPMARIPIQNMTRFWQETVQITANPAFGLKVGKHVQAMNFRALSLLLITSDSIAQALDKLVKYHSMASDAVNIRLQHKPGVLGYTVEPLQGVDITHAAIDAGFSAILKYCQDMLGGTQVVERVELMRSTPESTQPWEAFFNCPVTFNAQVNCLWFNRNIMEKNSIMADTQLATHHEKSVSQYIEKMNASSWSERSKQAIHSALSQEVPTLASIAMAFKMSDRTLARKLKSEGASFSELLQEKRQELASFYLLETKLSIIEVALNLGFKDVSNFNRAFQRWFKLTPSQYRTSKGNKK